MSLFSPSARRVAFVCGSLFLCTACGDDDPEEEHGAMSPACIDISEACHAADTGSGPAHDCHEIAHDDVEDDCAAALPGCVAACQSD